MYLVFTSDISKQISEMVVAIRHEVKPFQKGLTKRACPRPCQKGLSPSPFSKPFLKKDLSPSLSP